MSKKRLKKLRKKVLAGRDAVALLAHAAGEDPARIRAMDAADVDPDLRRIWLEQLVSPEPGPSPGVREPGAVLLAEMSSDKLRTLAIAAGEDPSRARTMVAAGVDPELKRLWLEQLSTPESETDEAPLGMDEDRYELHRAAKQLAQVRCDADPRLDPAEAYTLAAVEIVERDDAGVI